MSKTKYRSLESLIKDFESIPLTDSDIKHAMKNKVNIVLYANLRNIQNIESIFLPEFDGNVILHYPDDSRSTGHWVAMWKSGSYIFHFDPYGDTIDSNIKSSPYLLHQDDKTKYALTHLLNKWRKQGGLVVQNPYKIQRIARSVQTCGRHSCVRLLHKNKTDEEYVKWLNFQGLNPDYISSMLTYTSSFNS